MVYQSRIKYFYPYSLHIQNDYNLAGLSIMFCNFRPKPIQTVKNSNKILIFNFICTDLKQLFKHNYVIMSSLLSYYYYYYYYYYCYYCYYCYYYYYYYVVVVVINIISIIIIIILINICICIIIILLLFLLLLLLFLVLWIILSM